MNDVYLKDKQTSENSNALVCLFICLLKLNLNLLSDRNA